MANHDRSIQGYTDGVFWERNTLATQRQQNTPDSEPEQPRLF
jgi:site-specific DNA-methyltransferase (adenine-specific)